MNKPNNYDNVQAAGDFIPLDLGGHALVIKEVLVMESRTGRQMIKVSFDTAPDDKQPGYFANLFRSDIRPDKKWPHGGTQYILTEDNDGNASRNFKTFTTSVEKSNPGFEVVWGEGFAACFKNKRIGGVAGRVLDAYNGKEIRKTEIRWFRSIDKALEAEIPEEFETKAHKDWVQDEATGFETVPENIDGELPFT